jgi:hypothetical protein
MVGIFHLSETVMRLYRYEPQWVHNEFRTEVLFHFTKEFEVQKNWVALSGSHNKKVMEPRVKSGLSKDKSLPQT